MSNNETHADVIADMRRHIQAVQAAHDYPQDIDITIGDVEDWADRIAAAVERERRNYQRLHECFWEPSATQSVVRQMLDAADDLRSAYPKESDDLEYFANALIKCAKTAAVDAPGNTAALRAALRIIWDDARKPCKLDRAAVAKICKDALSAPPEQPTNASAMREALEKIARTAEEWDTPGIHAVQTTLYRILDAARAALAAPPRNCDVGTAEEQYRRFRAVCDSKDARQCSCCELRGLNSLNCSRDKCLARWAQLPYEGGAE